MLEILRDLVIPIKRRDSEHKIPGKQSATIQRSASKSVQPGTLAPVPQLVGVRSELRCPDERKTSELLK
jgi:hypothetical protein